MIELQTAHVYKSRARLLLSKGKAGKAVSDKYGGTTSPTLATNSETHQARGQRIIDYHVIFEDICSEA